MNLTMHQLVARIVKNPKGWLCGTPRWSAVSQLFSVGSTTAIEICTSCGQNPHEIRERKTRKGSK